MKNGKWIYFLYLSVFFFTGCTSNSHDPVITLKAFSEALKNKDFQKAKQLATPESANTIVLLKNGLNTENAQPIWLPVLADDFDYKETEISGDRATVVMVSKSKKEDFEVELKKINEEWRVNFEISSLFKIMLKKLNKKGAEKALTLDQTMNELKQIDLQQVENELDNSKQKIDSVRKEFKKNKKKNKSGK